MAYFAAGPVTAAQLEALVPIIKRKVADETVNNSSTLQNDDELAIVVAADTSYRLRATIRYSSGTTPDFKWAWSYPTGLTMVYSAICQVTTVAFAELIESSGGAVDGAGANESLFFDGTVVVSSTAGTLQFRWAQNTANPSDTIVRAGSYLELQQIVST